MSRGRCLARAGVAGGPDQADMNPVGHHRQMTPDLGPVCSKNERHARPRGSDAGGKATGWDRLKPEDVPNQAGHERVKRTRETYGGTEDPHQAQGL
ncbi:hypothetical protein NOCARDAX2BIS_110012 [Nocardioides sp. AX2bis]|nr:hypothetical protein NOCARDAX2BIS_110012 [Nocardioides sp. AX2bis]